MRKVLEWIKPWFFPDADKKTRLEIDTLNTKNIHYVSLVVGIVQILSLVMFFIINSGSLDSSEVTSVIIRVGLSVVLCIFGFFVSGALLKDSRTVGKHPTGTRVFIGVFIILLMIWSIYVSIYNYVNHQQLLTFYTVELTAVLFVKLKPAFLTPLILCSYIVNYLILSCGYYQGGINLYNYLMLAVLSAAGSMLNYRLTVNYISEKNKAGMLNESLEIIANHDSNTRLQNRYALNQRIPDYVDRDICIAMGDINSFKAINDTCGHRAGDDVLKLFSDILLEVFPSECIYRYGGDEFLIIEETDDLDGFLQKFDQINDRFSSAQLAGIQMRLGCSFGCVRLHPMDIAEFFDGLTLADKYLYDEKSKLGLRR